MVRFTWKMPTVLKRMKYQSSDFLYFELWSIVFTIYEYVNSILSSVHLKEIIVLKDAQCSETDFFVSEFFCANFSFWDMVDFVLNIRSELGTWDGLWIWLRNANQQYPTAIWLGGFNPKATGALGRNLPNIIFFSESYCKIYHIANTKNRKIWKFDFSFVSAHCASFM